MKKVHDSTQIYYKAGIYRQKRRHVAQKQAGTRKAGIVKEHIQ
jgi:hypothetical protein